MTQPRTYTIDELSEATGISRRTIAYYVQEGVLPRVGRRGPRTRYPQEFLHRLKLVARVRELENLGRMPAVTLEQIAEVLDAIGPDELRRLHGGDRLSAPEMTKLFDRYASRDVDALASSPFGPGVTPAAWRRMRLESLRQAAGGDGEALDLPPPGPEVASALVSELVMLLKEIDRMGTRPRRAGKGADGEVAPGATDLVDRTLWWRVDVSSGLSVEVAAGDGSTSTRVSRARRMADRLAVLLKQVAACEMEEKKPAPKAKGKGKAKATPKARPKAKGRRKRD